MSSSVVHQRKLISKSLKTKYEALMQLKSGRTSKSVAEEFGIPPNTLSTWKKNKEGIIKKFEATEFQANRVRMKTSKYEKVNCALYTWYCSMAAQNVAISGTLLQEKANEFAKALGFTDFEASNGG